jgi:hypothetical protein
MTWRPDDDDEQLKASSSIIVMMMIQRERLNFPYSQLIHAAGKAQSYDEA